MSQTVERLVERGYVPDEMVEAFRSVDRSQLLEPPIDRFADLDVPLPPSRGVHPGVSPRGAALLLRVAEVDEGTTLLVVGRGSGYLAALARRLTDGRVEHVGDPDEIRGTWDRVLWMAETGRSPDALDHVEDLGALVMRRRTEDGLEVVRVVKAGDTDAEMVLSDAEVVDDPYGDTGRAQPGGTDLASLLSLEESLARVWTANHLLRRERAWARSVDQTWRTDPVGDVGPEDWSLARRLFHQGFIYQMHADLETAIDVYDASLDVAPSAESYTFRGWSRSFLGDVDGAIEDCKRAIDTDPTLGNPYNDIGCYLLERGDLDEAESWFEQAKDAERYEAPHFPYLNLARLHLRRGDEAKALDAARESARINPKDPTTRKLLDRLEEDD